MRRPDGHPLIAAALDIAMAPMAHLRPRLVHEARGEVLELGCGTGANFTHYRADRVRSVIAVEPDPHMISRATPRAARAPVSVRLRQLSAEALPMEDGSFDTVIATWVFCSIPDPGAAAAEAFRVLRPGGRLLFVEHVGAEHPPTRLVQSGLDPAWQRCAGGCHLTRDPLSLFREAGFDLEGVRAWGPQRWTLAPLIRGDAVRPSTDDRGLEPESLMRRSTAP